MFEFSQRENSPTQLKPPFRIAGASSGPLRAHDADTGCCAKTSTPPASVPAAGRSKLWTLPARFYCSILGTCLTTQHLRKLVARCTGKPVEQLSDLAVHEEAVQLALSPDGGSRILHKALDHQHDITLKRFDKAKTDEDILALWEEAKHSGDIPGAYWAALTHRSASHRVHELVFGEVHMLSHLVGAANRADIRRLAILEKQNAELTGKIERQQSQLRDAIVSREDTIRRLNDQLAERIAHKAPAPQQSGPENDAEISVLRELTSSLQQRLVNETARREKAEARALSVNTALRDSQTALRTAVQVQNSLQAELQAAEMHLSTTRGTDTGVTDTVRTAISGRAVLYVGGRPGSTQAIRDLVEQAGGEFLAHDGGLENRNGLLAGDVRRADLIFFPVDCISHDAVVLLKRLCGQAGKRYHPLRTASIACFIAGMQSEYADEQQLAMSA